MTEEFIFSGPAYIAILPSGAIKQSPALKQKYYKIINSGIQQIKAELATIDYPLDISILFNAFTEKRQGDMIREADNFSFKNLYSDSGGLQIVSRGLVADKKAKEEVYDVQSRTDYAMCFDEIPLRNENIGSRLGHLDKVFLTDQLRASARLTAENIIEQIDYFRSKKSETKVIAIVQGNSVDDMVEWYDEMINTIPDNYWKQIAGIAIGGICLGFGQQEDVEKFVVYHRLRKEFPVKYTKKHLHILGVGSIIRLQPLIILRETGFIPKDTHISYDSTSLSMSYLFGNYLDEEGKSYKNGPDWETVFRYYYDISAKYLIDMDICTKEEIKEFYPIVVKDMLCYERITANVENDKIYFLLCVIRVLYNIGQIIPFTKALYKIKQEWNKNNDLIGMLKTVTDLDSYYKWQDRYGSRLSVKRITRKVTTEIEKQLEFNALQIADDIQLPKIRNKKSKSTLNAFFED